VVEGVHHRASDAISTNMQDQRENAVAVLKDLCADAAEVYFCRGTAAHAGQDSCDEEAVAHACGAIPMTSAENGRPVYTRQIVTLKWNGLVIHAAHHVGTTSVHNGKTTALMAELGELRATAGQYGLRAPDVVLRSHRHDGGVAGSVSRYGMAWSISTPPWSGKNGFAYKVRSGRVSQLAVGGGIHEYSCGRFLPWIESYPIMPELPDLNEVVTDG
jgi:hypothetical protein